MQKILFLTLVIIGNIFPLIAQDSNGNSSSQQIELDFQRDKTPPIILRAPMRIPIEVYYEKESSILRVYNYSETTGEVFLYLDGELIGYESEINTSFFISSPGFYKIEIIGENWIAEGYLEV
ncbi:MAG: hypothetical protein K2H46_11780 [Muribaculaceae bacterium]|nr:hypothetical protein [Muribaculaceae bacterium]